MATNYWIGDADEVTQISNGSIDTVDGTPANNTFFVTIGGFAISQVGDTDVATTAAALVVLLEASTHPYFAAVTWTNPSAGNITGTADEGGVPFTAVLAKTGGGTGTVTDFSDTTAFSGPNDWGTGANWSLRVIPVNSDDVVIKDGSSNIFWGLDQNAVTLDSITIHRTYTGKIGLNRTQFAKDSNPENLDSTKQEYRDDYLKIGSDRNDIGFTDNTQNPGGSLRIKIDNNQAAASETVIYSTSAGSSELGLPSVRLLLNDSSANIDIRSAPGGVGVAIDKPGETSTAGKITITDNSTGSKFLSGDGLTLTNYKQNGGTNFLNLAATITTVEVAGGSLATEGDYAVATGTINGGTWNANHIKTIGIAITTLNVDGGFMDSTNSSEARTWATVNLGLGGRLKTDPNNLTITTLNEPTDPFTISVS